MTLGYAKPLYILPFDHRGSFQKGMFGWSGTLSADQTAQIAATKQVIYDGFKAAVAGGVPKGLRRHRAVQSSRSAPRFSNVLQAARAVHVRALPRSRAS